MVIVECGVPQLLQQTGLQLDRNLLKLYNRNMISLLERFPKPGQSSLLLLLNLIWRLIDTFFEESWWRRSSFQGALLLDLIKDR